MYNGHEKSGNFFITGNTFVVIPKREITKS